MIGLTSNRFNLFKPSPEKVFKDLILLFYPKRFDIEQKKDQAQKLGAMQKV